MTQIFALISVLLNLVATVIYINQIVKNKSTPNPSSWVIWLVVNVVNLVTYFFLVDKSVWVTLASLTSTTVVSIIFLLSLIKGKFTKISRIDTISLVMAIGIGFLWKTTDNALVSNVALQIIFFISFFPTINGLVTKVARESPIPWFLGSFAYVLQIIIILLNPVTLWALIFPLIQIIGQGTIALISYSKTNSHVVH